MLIVGIALLSLSAGAALGYWIRHRRGEPTTLVVLSVDPDTHMRAQSAGGFSIAGTMRNERSN